MPGTQVAPGETGRDHKNIFGFLHHPEVDGNISALRIDTFHRFFFCSGIETVFFGGEDIIHFRQVFFKSREDVFYFPGKDACIPEKVTTGDKGLGNFLVRFFGKCFYLVDFRRRLFGFILNITITRVRVGWFNADGHQCIDAAYKIQRFQGCFGKLIFFHDQVIGRSRHHQCFGIFLIKLEGDISNAGRGVFPGRFCNNIFRGNIGQLVRYDADIFFRCNDIDIFFRNKMGISLKCLLYQGLTRSENIQKLLRKIRTAHRPETASDSSGHDGDVVVFVHFISLTLYSFF